MEKATLAGLDVKQLLDLYRGMLRLREFELKVQELYRKGMLPGFVHLYIGEEAVATGVCSNLRPDDLVYSTHRGHGHAVAKGVPARFVMAELWGKNTGSSAGRGGSMHMYAPEYGFMGTNGIVGAGIPLATGAALSAKLRKSGQVVVTFFGDGAVNSGSFHEGLNFGAVWNLPVVYVCENNLYATEMAFRRATKNTSVQSRAAAYKMPGIEVNGSDVAAVYEAARRGDRAGASRRRPDADRGQDLSLRWPPRRRSRNGLSHAGRSRGVEEPRSHQNAARETPLEPSCDSRRDRRDQGRGSALA